MRGESNLSPGRTELHIDNPTLASLNAFLTRYGNDFAMRVRKPALSVWLSGDDWFEHRLNQFGPKLRAMVMLLRHSGLRIQDAACLERSRLKDDKLFL